MTKKVLKVLLTDTVPTAQHLIDIAEGKQVKLPLDSKLVNVGFQHEKLCGWFEVDPEIGTENIGGDVKIYDFRFVRTGLDDVPEGYTHYKSEQTQDNCWPSSAYVLHIYLKVEEKKKEYAYGRN